MDFAVPGIAAVGGYSFISTPRQLRRCGKFELAVKRSGHPVATWLHDQVGGRRCAAAGDNSGPNAAAPPNCCCPGACLQARVGDAVAVRVGGTFTHLPADERRPLLLVAGGIGINPLLSILRHCCELAGFRGGGPSGSSAAGEAGTAGQLQQSKAAAAVRGGGRAAGAAPDLLPPHAALLYSASVPAELAFRAELEQLQRWADGRIRLQLHVTAPEWKGREAEWGGHWGRIGASDLRHALQWLACGAAGAAGAAGVAGTQPAGGCGGSSSNGGSSGSRPPALPPDLAVLLCGPAAMEDRVIEELQALGVAQRQIRFERWW